MSDWRKRGGIGPMRWHLLAGLMACGASVGAPWLSATRAARVEGRSSELTTFLADAMVNYLMTLGWAPQGETEIVPWSRIEADFRLEDVNHSPAFFDLKKLAAFNGEYIRAMDVEAFIDACAPWLSGDAVPWRADQFRSDVFRAMAELVQTRIVTLAEVPNLVDFLFLDAPIIDEASWDKTFGNAEARSMLRTSIDVLADTPWNAESLKTAVEAAGTTLGLKLGKAQAPVRVAVTGRTIGPPLFEALEILGRDAVLARLRAAADRLAGS